MNRLILIGNGFDLAHGLKTSYKDFITAYLRNAMEQFLSEKYYKDKLFGLYYNYNIYGEESLDAPAPNLSDFSAIKDFILKTL